MEQTPRSSLNSQVLRFADFRVDLHEGELHRNGTRIRLQDQPFQVLALLTQRAGEVITREELRQHLWPADTFVDFDNSLNAAVAKIREALEDSPESPRFIETLPRRGYRFIAPVEELSGNNHSIPSSRLATPWVANSHLVRRLVLIALLVGFAVGGTAYWAKQRLRHPLTETDTIVLSEFSNSTDDPVFDGTLKQALEIQLQQSPFLSLVPDQQVRETLRFMGRSMDEHVVGNIAQEVCQREGAKAVLQGFIKGFGSHYVLGLNASNCQTGASLVEEQAEVAGKEQVLAALADMASRLRGKLGESLASVEKYDTPLLQATTPSLDALKAYSLGVPEQEVFNSTAAIPFFRRAIELDPNFALAYAKMTIVYSDAGEDELARQHVRKAFALRERGSEREQLFITALYHDIETRNLEKKMEADRLWAKTYPREWFPHISLAFDYAVIGSFGQALEESKAAIRVAPRSAYARNSLAASYLGLNRWQEARTALEPLSAQEKDELAPYCFLYMGAFAQGDQAAMQKYLEAAQQNLRDSDKEGLQLMQSEVAAFRGQFRLMREFAKRGEQAATAVGFKQNVAAILAQQALWEAQVGNLVLAKSQAEYATAKARGVDIDVKVALVMALVGDSQKAEAIMSNLARRHPEDTMLNVVSTPMIRSAAALKRGNPRQAIGQMRAAEEYELGSGYMYYQPFMPTYLRGQAYLAVREGSRAAAEFQKILDHRGIDPASPTYALAYLGLGRAKALVGDVAGAEAAYQEFLSVWKEADADLPILNQAKAEYTKLQ